MIGAGEEEDDGGLSLAEDNDDVQRRSGPSESVSALVNRGYIFLKMEENMKVVNRWVYVIVGCVALLLSGLVYAWSVLSGPIAAEFPQWSAAQLSLTFTIVMSFFCIGGLVGGFLAGKVSQKVYLWVSAALFLVGFLLSANIRSLAMLYIGFGVICGFASGFSYNAVLATVGKWFPNKQGLISGILLMGFGISSFLIGKLYQVCTPDAIGAWRRSFIVLGVVSAVVMAICGFFLEKPGKDFAPPAAASVKKKYVNPVAMEAGTGEMLKKPAFWLYYLWAILLSAAGLALVSQASAIAKEVGPTVSIGTITTVVGLISIFNGIGRVILGGLFDKVGRSGTMQTVNVLFVVTGIVLIAALKMQSFPVLVAGFIIGGLAYGGVTPANAAFVSSYYGLKHYSLNLSVVVTNLMFASFGSTVAGALYDATGSYMSTYLMICGMALVGVLVSIGISICDKRMLAKMK